jgi:hypothetical protein
VSKQELVAEMAANHVRHDSLELVDRYRGWNVLAEGRLAVADGAGGRLDRIFGGAGARARRPSDHSPSVQE